MVPGIVVKHTLTWKQQASISNGTIVKQDMMELDL
jgi:hypothetical protein